jgi:hypothetical protein
MDDPKRREMMVEVSKTGDLGKHKDIRRQRRPGLWSWAILEIRYIIVAIAPIRASSLMSPKIK